ncbi:ABC transporter permease (plasmid) [Agrobacterium leguminum]|uniref:ABC transporter permease n=1 Tax=Agrobacterium leguminum TaxID=2792015 RepID=UPI00272B7B12|nr:ABC transporter permease [Agrobacterium leguminum]WLE00686.1 ABC transporter permease [Agrobacterium leguminum]
MKTNKIPAELARPVKSLLLFCALIALWEFVIVAGNIPAYLFPSPSAIGQAFYAGLVSGLYLPHLQASVIEIILGFAAGAGLGFVLGVAISLNETVAYYLRPYVLVFQTIPKVALAPVIVLWFGLGMESKIVTAAIICFFPVMVNTATGLSSADPERVELLQAMGANRRQIFTYLRMPTAASYIFAGLEISVTFALIGVIVAEFLGAERGLGMLMQSMNFSMDVAGSFSIVLVLAVLGILFTWLISIARRRIIYWEQDHRREKAGGGAS